MSLFSLSEIENLPETEGVFCFLNERSQTVFTGVAENLRREISATLNEKVFLGKEVSQIEIKNSDNKNLIKSYAETIRARKPRYNFNLNEQRHFPHFKVTGEKFPRLLVTRKIENDRAEYFGAFLPETGARLLLDFLNRTFRLRSCAIKIDGDFAVPCTQFYEKRCVAPCVENLCDRENYRETVRLIKLFLRNERDDLKNFIAQKIEIAAGDLDFESAADWRNILQNIQNLWDAKNRNYRLGAAVDSFAAEEKGNQIFVYLVSQRGRKILGKRAFVFEKIENFDAANALSQIVWQFYEFYAPKEIRVSTDFPHRKFLSKVLSRRENRPVKINLVNENNRKITAERGFGRAKFELDFRQIKPQKKLSEIQSELQTEFELKGKPERIEAFDAAHISGTDFVAAKSVWENGKFVVSDYEFWLLSEKSELETLEAGIRRSFETKSRLPDLILIDGGKSQLKAALRALENLRKRKFSIVAAVKPPGKHNEISHFINENGSVVKMKAERDAFQLLVRLRDEAHDLANGVHRQKRDAAYFYEAAAILTSINEKERRFLLQKYGSLKQLKTANKTDLIKIVGAEKAETVFADLQSEKEKLEPLIVPIRFDHENGDAQDLQPISGLRSK